MSRVEHLWERLVHAALRSEKAGFDAFGRPVGGIAGNVPSSLAKNRDIDAILRAADEIQDDDPNVSRICKFSYTWLYYFTVWCLWRFSYPFNMFMLLFAKNNRTFQDTFAKNLHILHGKDT